MKLIDDITILNGIGPKIARKLNSLGIKTIKDLIYYFPRDWQDFSHPLPINKYRIGQEAIIKAKIISIKNIRSFRKKMFITKAEIEDSEGNNILAVWFNQPYLANVLRVNSTWLFAGRIDYDFSLKQKTIVPTIYVRRPEILSVYPETKGINSKFFRKILKIVLQKIKINDFLTSQYIKAEGLINLPTAIRQIHFPSTIIWAQKAKQRLVFDELFLLSLKMMLRKNRYKSYNAPIIKINKKLLLDFEKFLPFKLTLAQQKAVYDILADMNTNSPMIRLLNGDVGSGKTIVVIIASLMCCQSGYQTVWMAPTEILANQHFKTAKKFLKDFNINIGLLTSQRIAKFSNQKNKKQKTKNKLSKDESKSQVINSDLIIGTHSLIQKDIQFNKLGLIIIDEEHRFGVKQRIKLIKSSKKKNIIPHYLSMSATPIPRTLAVSIYGDLDISIINQMPAGRKKIITRLIDSSNRTKAYDFIRKHIINGRQVFVVCPLIEEIDNSKTQGNLFDVGRKSVKHEYDKLRRKIFPEFKIGILHGKMPSQNKSKSAKKSITKQQAMDDFQNGKIDIIVSTSVVEVGVDVPNANFMLIEDADRFGLAQLHQFRGRIGRGKHQSFCLLFSNNLSPKSKKRLLAMEKYSDGFKLARIDLSTRGPGEFIGNQQSGFNQLKIANLTDTISLKRAQRIAKKIISIGLEKFPRLKNILKDK